MGMLCLMSKQVGIEIRLSDAPIQWYASVYSIAAVRTTRLGEPATVGPSTLWIPRADSVSGTDFLVGCLPRYYFSGL